MQNVKRSRAIGLGFVVSGIVAAAAAALLATSDGMRVALGMYGGLAVLFGGFWAGSKHRDVRALEALARGEDVLVCWRVDPDSWRRFLELDRAEQGLRANELSARDDVSPSGVEVIVGKEAIAVGGSVHRLPGHGEPQVTHVMLNEAASPPFVEMQLYRQGMGAEGTAKGPLRTRLRFPVGLEAVRDARQVVAHYSGNRGEPDFFHGRGDGSDPEDLSRCWSCGFETHVFRSHCPQCGSTLQSRRWSRRAGILLTICGLFITVVLGYVLWFLVPMLLHPGQDFGGTRFGGNALQAGMILVFLCLVEAFGATAVCYGIFQMTTGRRDKRVVGGMVTGFLVLLAGAVLMVALG